MKRIPLIFIILASLLLFPGRSIFSYQEISTSLGKVIIGIDRDEALREFGIPQEAGERLWHYSGTQNFFVYLNSPVLLGIQLYPQSSQVTLGYPLELKVYAYFSDSRIKDITDKAQVFVNKRWDFNFTKSGGIIPLKTGKYQLFVKYENLFSNPCQITVEEPKQEVFTENEVCLAVNLIPFEPSANPNTSLSFKAFGTFFSRLQNTYYVKDITRESQWFFDEGSGVSQSKDNAIRFGPRRGKARVFCRYKGTDSFPQIVNLTAQPISRSNALKHITALPELASIEVRKHVVLRALATYENNDIKDISNRVSWKLSNRDTLVESSRGEFFGAYEGICEVYAELEGVRSNGSKISVRAPADPQGYTEAAARRNAQPQEKKEEEESPADAKNLLKDIKKDAEQLVKDVLGKEKKLKAIRIDPASFKIAVGESAQASAWGAYDDYSEEEITNLGEWKPLDERLFGVQQGKVSAYAPGASELYVKFKGVTSPPAKVTIEGPKLTSIVVTPMRLRISMAEERSLSAEGHFSDSSHKDITDSVSWGINGPQVVRMKKAIVRPLKIGRTKVYAQHGEIKSLPVDVTVVFTWGWLALWILNFSFFLLCAALLTLAVFYLLTLKKKKELKSLMEKDPRGFAVKIYENAKEVLEIFGFRQKEVLPPLAYASLVDQRYTLNFYYYGVLGLKKDASMEEIRKKYHELALAYHPDKVKPEEAEKAALRFKEVNEAHLALSNPKSNRTFFNFTQRFEEAKYSSHSFERGEAATMLSEYDYFMNVLSSHYDSRYFLLKYCLALLRRKPLHI